MSRVNFNKILSMDKKKFQEILKKYENGEIAKLLRHGGFFERREYEQEM